MAELERAGGGGGGGGREGEYPASVGTVGEAVPLPARQYRTARGGDLFQVSVPTNWTAVSSTNSVKFVPQNAYGSVRGQTVLTHGVQLGVARSTSRDLREATDSLVAPSSRATRICGRPASRCAVRMSNRNGIGTPLVGRSALGGTERVGVYTTLLADGNLFYYLTVVPEDESPAYGAAFDHVGKSIRLNDR